jgi:hypothetical protein
LAASFVGGVFAPISSAVSGVRNTLTSLSSFFSGVFEPIISAVDFVSVVFNRLRSIISPVSSAFESIQQKGSELFQPISRSVEGVQNQLTQFANFFKPITDLMGDIWDALGSIFNGFLGLGGLVAGAAGIALFAGLGAAVISVFSGTLFVAMTTVSGMLTAAGSALSTRLTGIGARVADGIGNMFGQRGMGDRYRERVASRRGRAGQAAAGGMPDRDQNRGRRGRRGRGGRGMVRMANTITRVMTAMTKAGAAFSKAMIAAAPGIAIVTAAILGIALALRIATPAIEAIVPLGIRLAEVLGGVLIQGITSVAEIAKAFAETVGQVLIAAMDNTYRTLELLTSLDPSRLFQTAAAVTALGVSLAALGAGQAAQGIGSFVGNLLGGDVFEKMVRLGELAPQLQIVESVFANFGSTIDSFNAAVENMNADHFVSESARIAESIRGVKAELNELGVTDMIKLAMVGGSAAQPLAPEQTNVVENNTTNNETTVQGDQAEQAQATELVESQGAPQDQYADSLNEAVRLLREIHRHSRDTSRKLDGLA